MDTLKETVFLNNECTHLFTIKFCFPIEIVYVNNTLHVDHAGYIDNPGILKLREDIFLGNLWYIGPDEKPKSVINK